MTLDVRVYQGSSEIQALADVWQSLQHHPNSDYEHFLLVCRLRSEVIAPVALGFWEDNTCRAIIAGRVERLVLRPAIGYARLPGLSVKALTIINEGILGVIDAKGADAAASALRNALRTLDADVATIHLLPEAHPIWDSLRRHSGIDLGLKQPHWTVHRALHLENEPGFLVRQMRKKHRADIRKKERDLSASFLEKVSWQWHTTISDISILCEQMDSIARMTYQRGLGAGFVDNEENRQRLGAFGQRGQLRALLLEINGRAKAFWLGILYRGECFLHSTAYTPDVASFEVGTLSFLRMVDELVREGVSRIDLGLGDAYYKERFGNREFREASVQLFPTTPKGVLLYAYLAVVRWLDGVVRLLVQRLGIFNQIKKTWRKRLQK